MKARVIMGATLFSLAGSLVAATTPKLNDAQIRKAVIQASIAEYPGSCPCPYNADRAGRSCGRRSAYSRAGGYGPKCYAKDVTPEDVAVYRQSHKQ